MFLLSYMVMKLTIILNFICRMEWCISATSRRRLNCYLALKHL